MVRSSLILGLFAFVGCTSAQEPAGTASADDTSAANNGLIALRGTYQSRGNVTPETRLTVDVIDTRQADATEHLAALEASGASCFFVGADTYRCTTVKGDVSAASLHKIAQNNSFSVTFAKPSAPPVLVSQADSLTEWQVNQSGSSDNGSFGSYRYLDLGDGLVKIVLPDGSNAGQGTELIVKSATELGKYATVTVTESHWRFFQDSALVVLE